MDHDFVKEQLIRYGHKNVTDEIVDEFLEKLQQEDEIPIRPSYSKYNPLLSAPKTVTKKRNRLTHVKITDFGDDNEDEAEYVIKREKKPLANEKIEPKNKQIRTKKVDYLQDEELIEWMKKLNKIRTKADVLDSQIQQCKKAIDGDVCLPIRAKKVERKQNPVTLTKKKTSGGYIRPPPIRSSRKSKGNNGRKLLYEERNPEYIPPPERRRDALRWQIRQKLIYSDPKYH